MNISSNTITKTFVAIALAIAGLAVTSSAQAWGVCGRGQPVETGLTTVWAEQSMCSCSNGQRGTLMVRGPYDWGYGAAWGSASGGGVGGEMEAWDREAEEVVWVGMTLDSLNSFAIRNGYEAESRLGGWFTNRYEPLYRYRSVCITNYKSVPKPSFGSVWFWNG